MMMKSRVGVVLPHAVDSSRDVELGDRLRVRPLFVTVRQKGHSGQLEIQIGLYYFLRPVAYGKL
jgi:hypothetical protein